MAILGNTTITKLSVLNDIVASLFKKDGGTSSLFLKADGSVDSNVYITSSGSITGNASTATSAGTLTNLTRQSSGPTWGTLASGYTSIGHWADAGGGGMALGYKSGQMSMQIDGKFYQNEGANKVLDSADVSTSGSGWGASLTVDGKTLTIPSRPSYTQSEISPTISKKYTGLYYATAADDQSKSAFFFISARPDSWYKPWKVRFRIRSVIPAATNCDSVSWVELYGRADSVTYKIYNERYDHAHYYAVVRILKLAGFNAVNGNSKSLSLGHAIGINLLYSNSYTNATYYRNFDLDYYDSYGCTVSVLDSPVNWSGWTNNSDSYYNGYSNYDAVSRGLQETGDNDSYAYNVSPYYRYQKAGANGVYGYNIITEDTAGCLSGFVKSRSVENNKTKNNVSFKVGSPLYYNTASGETSSGSIVYGYNIRTYYSLIDFRYSVNVASGVLTAYKPLYIKGLLNTDLTSYTLPDTWWTQDLPTSEDGCVYIYLGMVYPDSSTYRISWEEYHPSYIYKNGTVRLMGGHASFAEAVKNGVYITGAQTITGNKTFSGSTTIDSLTAGNLTVNGATSLTGDTNAGKVIATSFVKSGGTSSLFLMADGSVTSGYTKNAGTVTSVATGVGLTGGTITSSGTLKAKLKNETLTTEAAIQPTYNKDRLYEVRADKDGYLSVVVPWTNVNSSYMTTSHAANGITSTNISNWNAVHTWYTTAASGDTDTLINNWNDIVRFLENTSDETTLLGLLAAKLNKAGGTVTGDLIVNGGTTLNTLSAVSLSVTGAASFSNPINGDILGNATTADRLKNARTINGITFDGSANITVVDNTKLPLTGGTVTGPITINSSVNNNYNEGLRITRAGNSWAGITFGSTGTSGAPSGGWFAATNPSDQFIINPDDSGNTAGLCLNKGGDLKWRNNTVYHSGNFTPGNYLPLTGGSSKALTGDLYFSKDNETAYLKFEKALDHPCNEDSASIANNIKKEIKTDATLCAPFLHIFRDTCDYGAHGGIYFGDGDNCWIREDDDDKMHIHCADNMTIESGEAITLSATKFSLNVEDAYFSCNLHNISSIRADSTEFGDMHTSNIKCSDTAYIHNLVATELNTGNAYIRSINALGYEVHVNDRIRFEVNGSYIDENKLKFKINDNQQINIDQNLTKLVGNTQFKDGNVFLTPSTTYIGSTSGSRCNLQMDTTNKCLKFVFD